MCGIAGVVSLAQSDVFDNQLIVRMSDRMHHRGPDGQGFLFSAEVPADVVGSLQAERPEAIINQRPLRRALALGHRRLSILDLSPLAGQPMRSHDEQAWITFNGEIYNYLALREELVQLGYQFRTDHSDTEVILHAYQAWGTAAVKKLRGMFAFALYDNREDLLWIVRDRVGIKPLYFTLHQDRLHFASEIKALLMDASIPRRMSDQGVYNYLTFQRVPPPNTIFEGIYKLPAGCEIVIRQGNYMGYHQYWDVFDGVRLQPGSLAQDMEELDHLLQTSVRLRLQADVPYGVYLSGGLDSSALVSYVSDMVQEPVKTFSIGYAHNELHTSYKNEFPYSRMVASHVGATPFELEVTEEQFIGFAAQLAQYLDEPTSDPVAASMYFVSRLAKENGVTVCLGGEGSDEIFGGYIEWRYASEFDQVLKKLGPMRSILKPVIQAPLVKQRRPYYATWYERLHHGKHIFWGGAIALEETEKRRILSASFLRRIGTYSSWEALDGWYRDYLDRSPAPNALNWMSYVDLKFRLPDLLLARLDKMSMAASVEARVPFLDHEVIRFAMGLPYHTKIAHGQEKLILKQVMEGRLPHEIIYRGKVGFSSPINEWILSKLGDIARQKIREFNAACDVFDPVQLEHFLYQASGMAVWRILGLALWWEEYIVKQPAYA